MILKNALYEVVLAGKALFVENMFSKWLLGVCCFMVKIRKIVLFFARASIFSQTLVPLVLWRSHRLPDEFQGSTVISGESRWGLH